MVNTIASTSQTSSVVLRPKENPLWRATTRSKGNAIKWYIRYTLYAFVFSLPFEEAFTAIGATIPKLLGVALAAFALLQPKLCYRFPPKAFWYIAIYLFVVVLSGSYLLLYPPNVSEFSSRFIGTVSKIVQSLLLFWLCYNLMRHDGRVITGTIWAFAAATLLLAILQLLGVTSGNSEERMAAFEGNPNSLANVLSLGFLSLFGVAYGREKFDWKGRVLFWCGAGIILVTMVQTGSRGGLLALVGTLSVVFLRGKTLATKLKFGLIGLAGIIVLLSVSYTVDSVRQRWERSFYEQSFSGRERIYPTVIAMILERPVSGWGPVNHHWELGSRLGRHTRDEHNSYLYLLNQVGLVGAVPFFVALWLCGQSAWRARASVQGILPFVMLLLLLVTGMKGSIHGNKYFWVVLAYALAASHYTIKHQQHGRPNPSSSFGLAVKAPSSRLLKVPARYRHKALSARQVRRGTDQ